MGARAQIEVKQKPYSVFLYTHWGADTILQDTIQGMIKGKSRWSDSTYLTRILFDSLKKPASAANGQVLDDSYSTTGYGIGTFQAGDIEKLVVVDIEHQRLSFYAVNSNVNQDRVLIDEWKFDEFVEDTSVIDILFSSN